jgi:hypothetical protein
MPCPETRMQGMEAFPAFSKKNRKVIPKSSKMKDIFDNFEMRNVVSKMS